MAIPGSLIQKREKTLSKKTLAKTIKTDKNSPTIVFSLRNGLRIILHQIPVIDMVSVLLRVNTGSNYEGRFLGSGISHFLEHAMFLGSSKFPGKDQFSNLIQGYGGIDLNAFTGETSTCYQFSVLSRYLLPALDALHDFTFHPLLRKKDIEEERGTIVSEMDLYDDKAADWFYRLIFSRIFFGEPNELPIIGLRKIFHQITAQDLREYHQLCYRPNNLNLTLVGQFDIPTVKSFLEKKFSLPGDSSSRNILTEFYPGGQRGYWRPSSWPEGQSRLTKISPSLPSSPTFKVTRVTETCHHRVEFVRVALGWEGCDFFHSDNITLDILSHILASGRGSVLYDILKENLSWVEKISAFSLQTHPHGLGRFFIEFTLPQNKKNQEAGEIEKVTGKIISVLQKINRIITEELLIGSKNTFLKTFIQEKEDFMDVASTLSYSLSYYGHLNFESEYLRHINRLSREETVTVVKKYLSNPPHLFILLPKKVYQSGALFPEHETERISSDKLMDFEEELEGRIAGYQWQEISPAAEKKYPTPVILSSQNPSSTQKENLSQGGVFLHKKITGLPMINLQLIFRGGSCLESKQSHSRKTRASNYTNGSFNLLSQMFFASNLTHSKKEIAEILRHNGIIYNSHSGENTLGMGFSLLKERLPILLSVLQPILANVNYRKTDFLKEKRDVIYSLKKSKEDSFRTALRDFKKHFFGDTGYALDPKGDEKIIPSITASEVLNLKKNFITRDNVTAHLVGDFHSSHVRAVRQILEGINLSPSKKNRETEREPKINTFHYRDMNSLIGGEDAGNQSHFLMGYRIPALGQKGSGEIKLVSHYLEGIGGPLFKLRSSNFVKEGKSLGGRCYRLGCFMKSSKYYGMLVFYASFRKEAAGEHGWALEAFQKELEGLRRHKIEEKEIERAKTSLLAEMKTDSIKYQHISLNEGLLETYGLGHDFGEKETAQLQNITGDHIREAVNCFLDKENFLAYAMKPQIT